MDDVKAFLDDHELIESLARYAEGLESQAAVKKRHRLADSVWESLGSNDQLVEKIEARKLARVKDGSCKREFAQKHVVKAPEVLNDIMLGDASPKHKIDAAKTLDALAASGPQSGPVTDRFVITINLTADGSGSGPDVLHFDKSIPVTTDDPNDVTPQAVIAAIATKKDSSDGGQGHL